jgi:hypothetical protein
MSELMQVASAQQLLTLKTPGVLQSLCASLAAPTACLTCVAAVTIQHISILERMNEVSSAFMFTAALPVTAVSLQAALKQLQQQGLQALPASSSDPRSVKQVSNHWECTSYEGMRAYY